MFKVSKETKASKSSKKEAPRPRLVKLIIKNFSCIGAEPVEIDLDDIVVLVGPNNSGKSSVLKAYEVVMSEGSKQGKLTLDDFPGKTINPKALPEMELHTIVYDEGPGKEWIQETEDGERLVREKWVWPKEGDPIRRGFNVNEGRWTTDDDKEKVPWGISRVANSRRPKPHRIDAFDSPEKQCSDLVKLLMAAVRHRLLSLESDSESEQSPYRQLVDSISQLQESILHDSIDIVEDVQQRLTEAIGCVFPDHIVKFELTPEEDVDSTIKLFDGKLLMGEDGGHLSTIEFQGSGARRTLLWTALRILAESGEKKTTSAKPYVLLLDEPEICLHPNAIREACSLLYGLPESTNNWQVMVTTHSPCFVDFSRDHTTIVRVERNDSGEVCGTTIFRPEEANFSQDEKEELKLLNLCDPYVAEFFFGGRTILVEGDTEYTALKEVIATCDGEFNDVHIVRARGKAMLALLARILNQFGNPYAVLHDSDKPEYTDRNGKTRKNPAWTMNESIMAESQKAKSQAYVVASVPNFDAAFLKKEFKVEKPYSALRRLRDDSEVRAEVENLLRGLLDPYAPLPEGAVAWSTLEELESSI